MELGAALLAGSVAGIGAAAAPGALPDLDDRFLLSCTGAMAADGRTQPDKDDPASRIVASAVVDLAALSVNGFGVGAAPIVVVTPGTIGFGTGGADGLRLAAEPAGEGRGARSGTIVEGSIDRVSGMTTVIVHPAADPARVLIAMRLDCAMEPAPG
jgi:hypothetical protein